MEYTSDCKGCSRSVKIPSEDIRKMIDEIINSKNFDLVSKEEYNKRLEYCANCKYLEYDTTCIQCGCIVQVRALIRGKDCPNPSKSRWQ